VSDGAGHAILPRHAVTAASRPEAFVVRRIVRPSIRTKLTIAMSSRRATTLTQKTMLALIKDVSSQLLS
jgi:LysR family nitrogen assimilation transcriptional regulator